MRHAGRNIQGRIVELQYDIDVNTLESRHATQLPLNHVGRIVLETSSPCSMIITGITVPEELSS